MRRLDLKVGYSCNNLCRHCVQGEKRYKLKSKTTSEIQSELEEAFSRGIQGVVFTGGEPTVRKDIVENVKFAKKIGYETIQIQTNGRMFSSESFAKRMIDAGMTEFSPALNGHIPELHDYISQVSGAWRQTVQGIKNVRKNKDIQILTNTVITKPNYRHAKEIAELLVSLGVNQYQLAFVHAGGRAWTNFDSIVPFVSLAAPYIHKGLQVGIDAGVSTMAEAMPFCVMKGYEKQVSELQIPPADVYESGFQQKNWEEWRKNEGKWKGEACKKCKFYKICEGPWKEYVEVRGSSEFIPVLGKQIDSIDFL